MSPETRALLWCLGLLAACELGLRLADRATPTTGAIGVEERLVVLVGTSRTQHGLDPAVVEEALAEAGIDDVFVGNASRVAATNIGLLQEWAEDVLPAVAGHGRGVVAIELRVEGFNDGYSAEGEKVPERLLGKHAARLESLREDDALELLAAGELDAAAWWLLSRLRLTDLPEELRKRLAEEQVSPEDAARNLPPWARGERGYEVRRSGDRTQDLTRVQDHYRNKVLADFDHGGRQTVALETLIASVRDVGMTPVLYLMPVTDDHKTVYPKGMWALILGHIEALAEAQGVSFVDLDEDHGLSAGHFSDTSHLRAEGAALISRRLAERALAPLLR